MSKIKICLDAGHVGSKYNQSPVVKTYYESAMNWKLHLKLKAELEDTMAMCGVHSLSEISRELLF